MTESTPGIPMKWICAADSDVGRVRPGNEDALFTDEERGVFLVADGMGGHAAGEIASRMATEMIGPGAAQALDHGLRGEELDRRTAELIREANRAILERAGSEPDKRGMGTTVTLLVLTGRHYHLAQVGDSRAYVLRGGELEQVTRDHTVVQQQVEQGMLSADQARGHPLSHILTRALGTDTQVDPDTYRGELHAGDVFLLCSDGLTGMLGDREIEEALIEHEEDLGAAVSTLVEAANRAGGQDNITIVLVKALPDG